MDLYDLKDLAPDFGEAAPAPALALTHAELVWLGAKAGVRGCAEPTRPGSAGLTGQGLLTLQAKLQAALER